jgi:RNA polymerase sigma-70 factor, ECF subfamily
MARKSESSLEVLYLKYADAVRAKLRRRGIEGVDLDELVQDVFCIAARRYKKIPKDDEGARRWLLDTARKHSANWHRLYRHTYEQFGQEAEEAIRNTSAEPEDPAAYFIRRDLVRRALSKIRPEDADILARHDLDGESLQELARWLGITKSGAHVRLQGARERLRLQVDRLSRGSSFWPRGAGGRAHSIVEG